MSIAFSVHRTGSFQWVCAVVCVCLCFAGCSDGPRQPENQKVTIKTQGVITIDGEPGAYVQIKFHPKGGGDESNRSFSRAVTDENGKFTVTTYLDGDGLPPGEYNLTFEQYERTLAMGDGGRPDLLQGLYANPKKSQHTVTIPELSEEEQPYDMGTIDLAGPGN